MVDTARTSFDPQNPWPGLAPFEEGDRGYFHSRETEAADILRLVRSESLTVRFGRSGLGKISLRKAGLFPALRKQVLLPVHVRLDHGPAAHPLRTRCCASCRPRATARRVRMEGLKCAMPSVRVNRLRLLPMAGAQAYAVVMQGGGALVDDDVARHILRLAWKNKPAPPAAPEEFSQIEIDPALLSVVCSELSHRRRMAEPPLAAIDAVLLAGADREILSGFCECSMAGLDARVRAVVENKLITDRGFRDSHDCDDASALPGVSREALDALVARRLLRVDEPLGHRWLELTHDMMTRVVKDSRVNDWPPRSTTRTGATRR